MKTQIFDSHQQTELAAANGDFQQLELDLEIRSGASGKILEFTNRRVRAMREHDDVSKRLLDFAATLPDW